MALIKLDAVSLAYGHVALLDHVDFQIDTNERVCLVGRNGTGKSTMMQILRGTVIPDDGSVWRQQDMRLAYLAQEVPPDQTQSVFDVIAAGGWLFDMLGLTSGDGMPAGSANGLDLETLLGSMAAGGIGGGLTTAIVGGLRSMFVR